MKKVKNIRMEHELDGAKELCKVRRNRWEPCPPMKPSSIKAIREHLKASQTEFAYLLGVKVATLQNWEQGRRVPDGAAQTLLRVIAYNPNVVMEALY